MQNVGRRASLWMQGGVALSAGLALTLLSSCRPSIDDNLPENLSSSATSSVTKETLIQDIPNGGITPEKLSQAYLPLAGGTLTGTLTLQGATLAMGGNKITHLATPTASTDAATKGYVDAASATVAPPSVFSLTANSGLYNNQIQEVTPTVAYIAVCFKSGHMYADIHAANEAISSAPSGGLSTDGGAAVAGSAQCAAGDVGFIIEKAESAAASWHLARIACLKKGMRLPEPFEWKTMCEYRTNWGVADAVNNWEWASNFTLTVYNGGHSGVGSVMFGGGGCIFGGWGWLGSNTSLESSSPYRCAL